jgi:hypothetical protein
MLTHSGRDAMEREPLSYAPLVLHESNCHSLPYLW